MKLSRPKSLAEVADRTLGGGSYSSEFSDFLDEFYLSPDAAMLSEEPVSINTREDAFLAATAEFLAQKFDFQIPQWVFRPGRSLSEPDFEFTTRGGKLFLLKDSPAAFKSRNLFVTAAVLDRM